MNNNIIKFCDEYKRKLDTDKDIEENPGTWMSDFRDRIHFNISVIADRSQVHYLGNPYQQLFELDAEDLAILHAKYSKRVLKEMEDNIKSVTDKYQKYL